MTPAEVATQRKQLWQAGFRPVPIYNAVLGDKTTGKAPWGEDWPGHARAATPRAAVLPVRHEALNTGILCDGLRAVDLDIDNPTLAQACHDIAIEMLGSTLKRFRQGSPRCLLVYRAAEGAPRKITVAGTLGKIEVLGAGQQFVAFGQHFETLAWLEWEPHAPGVEMLEDVPAVTEEAVHAFTVRCAQLLGAKAPQVTNGHDHAPNPQLQADPLRIAAALGEIDNDGPPNWTEWKRVAMAVWAATGGSSAGWEMLNAWSSRHGNYDPAKTQKNWTEIIRSPANRIGAGTIFHLARQAIAAREARQDAPQRPTIGRILTGAEFIARHVPPVWLIDGIVQRGRLYACSSLTGHGKTAVWLFNACMIQAGRQIGLLDVFQGNVLILAGENPADLEARMIAMAKTYNIPHDRLPYVLPGSFPLTDDEAEALKREIAGLGVPLVLIVGDTAAAFFPGEDENDNVQSGKYARTLRTFTECAGNPCVVVLAHPIKNASRSNLLPRGGGSFLNELDGNLTLWSENMGEVTELHWQGKIRGPDFAPFGYRLRSVPTGMDDERERPEITVVAEPMSEEAVADHAKQSLANEDVVLRAMRDHPDWSYASICHDAGWVDLDGKAMKPRVQRAIQTLAAAKLVAQSRPGARWKITAKGRDELDAD